MEQLNNVLASSEAETRHAAVNDSKGNNNSPLLNQVRQKFGFFGTISLTFGIFFAFLFYNAGIGLNVFAFAAVMVFLLTMIMKKLNIPLKKTTIAYYTGTILLGLSSMLTSSPVLQFLNMVGMLFLLDLSLIHQFHEDGRWDFAKHLTRMFGLILSCIVSIGMPFVDSLDFLKKTKLLKTERSKNIVLGIVIAIPLLWIIVALLSSADLLFGEMTKKAYRFLFSSEIINVLLMIIFGCISCYCIICGAARKTAATGDQLISKKSDPAIAVSCMTLIGIVYAFFCGIQIIYLFTDGLMVLPDGFTFAEYARRGFFELLAVTVINIVLMLICSTVFRKSKILRFILTGITVCTYIMIASATYRMLLYISAYNLTFLRLFVLLFLLIDAIVLAGVIISEYKKEFLLFRYSVAVIVACYLIFSFAKPDYYIAAYHINNKEILNSEDIIYLTEELSYDAAPAVIPLLSDPESLNAKIKSAEGSDYESFLSSDFLSSRTSIYYDRINSDYTSRGIRDFNYSYYQAFKYAKLNPVN